MAKFEYQHCYMIQNYQFHEFFCRPITVAAQQNIHITKSFQIKVPFLLQYTLFRQKLAAILRAPYIMFAAVNDLFW